MSRKCKPLRYVRVKDSGIGNWYCCINAAWTILGNPPVRVHNDLHARWRHGQPGIGAAPLHFWATADFNQQLDKELDHVDSLH